MYDSFKEQLRSQIADVKNVGSRWGGAITAAKFLEHFVAEYSWHEVALLLRSIRRRKDGWSKAGVFDDLCDEVTTRFQLETGEEFDIG